MHMGKKGRMAVLALAAALLAGCGMTEEEAWEPRKEAAVSIDKEGKITEYLSEKLDQPYYDFDELRSMLDSEISEYNAGHGEGKVTAVQAEQEGGQVKLVITYASGEDYAAFNHVEFFYGSMISAQLAGYLFDVSYKEVSDGIVHDGEVDGSKVLSNMADMVAVVEAPLEVNVPGKVVFTSTGGEVLGKDVVFARGEEDEQSVSEDPEADRVYIIFEEE